LILGDYAQHPGGFIIIQRLVSKDPINAAILYGTVWIPQTSLPSIPTHAGRIQAALFVIRPGFCFRRVRWIIR
jgi:hypothetical protein